MIDFRIDFSFGQSQKKPSPDVAAEAAGQHESKQRGNQSAASNTTPGRLQYIVNPITKIKRSSKSSKSEYTVLPVVKRPAEAGKQDDLCKVNIIF